MLMSGVEQRLHGGWPADHVRRARCLLLHHQRREDARGNSLSVHLGEPVVKEGCGSTASELAPSGAPMSAPAVAATSWEAIACIRTAAPANCSTTSSTAASTPSTAAVAASAQAITASKYIEHSCRKSEHSRTSTSTLNSAGFLRRWGTWEADVTQSGEGDWFLRRFTVAMCYDVVGLDAQVCEDATQGRRYDERDEVVRAGCSHEARRFCMEDKLFELMLALGAAASERSELVLSDVAIF